jgi:hypothetical protein
MAFYRPDRAMAQVLENLVRALELEGRPGLSEQLSVTWVRFPYSQLDRGAQLDPQAFWALPCAGASWHGDGQRYPASVVKLIYLVAAEFWLQQDRLADDPELRRALAAMVQHSSNNATEHVLDRLSGTTGGPALEPAAMATWSAQRQLVNQWLQALGWPELSGSNACQKTWDDGPYGRERVFYGVDNANRNRLSSDGVARMLLALMAGVLVSPPACARMRQLLFRSLDSAERAADPENQVDGFLGEGLPQGTRLWSKAGWMSRARHDAAYIEHDELPPTLLVVFSEGENCAADASLLPEIARHLIHARLDG